MGEALITRKGGGGAPKITKEVLNLQWTGEYNPSPSYAYLSKSGRTLFVDCFPVVSEQYLYFNAAFGTNMGITVGPQTDAVTFSLSGSMLTVSSEGYVHRESGGCRALAYPKQVTVYYID